MSASIVGDFNLEGNGVAFGRRIVSAGQCLDRDQISFEHDAAEIYIGSIIVDIFEVTRGVTDNAIGVVVAVGRDIVCDTIAIEVWSRH